MGHEPRGGRATAGLFGIDGDRLQKILEEIVASHEARSSNREDAWSLALSAACTALERARSGELDGLDSGELTDVLRRIVEEKGKLKRGRPRGYPVTLDPADRRPDEKESDEADAIRTKVERYRADLIRKDIVEAALPRATSRKDPTTLKLYRAAIRRLIAQRVLGKKEAGNLGEIARDLNLSRYLLNQVVDALDRDRWLDRQIEAVRLKSEEFERGLRGADEAPERPVTGG